MAAAAPGFYRFEAKIISRGGGRSLIASAAYRTGGKSATSAAAYRAGEQLTDERTGETYDYTKKRGIKGAEIMLPTGAPAWMNNRARLWNAVEAAEKRKDAQTARDYLLSIPHQLSPEQRRALVKWFIAEQFVKKGYAADIAFHGPDAREGLNHHAHVMVTMRKVEGDGFCRMKERPPAGTHPMKAWKDDLLKLREAWAHSANRFLEAAGLDIRVTHESLQTRGIDREPDPKLGPVAAQIEAAGRESHAGSDRREVAERNAERVALRAELAELAAAELDMVAALTRDLRSGAMTPEPPTEEELRRQAQLEAEGLRAIQKQELERAAQMREAFKRQSEQAAEEAKKQREQSAKDEAARQQRGEIASPAARYSAALAADYDIRDPYGSLAKAAMSEYGAFVKQQEQLKAEAAKEQDGEKRRLIELRREIEAHDYMAITSQRLAGISATIAGREDAPQAQLDRAKAEAHAARGAELRNERAELIAERARQEQAREADRKRNEGRIEAQPGLRPDIAADPARQAEARDAKKQDERRVEDESRAAVTGRKEGDAELSDAQRAKLDKWNATREATAAREAQKQKDRDRGGGGRSGR